MEPITVTIADACKVLGIGRTKIYELLQDRELHSVTIGRRRLIKTDSIRALVEREVA
jgi:excisionase family DNA binding protein